ncbi:aldehyde dehydrogenase family protein [Phaeobacter italicus]|uniref:aldehyde dehydrogenase family protein n=1 Tax=Phaeobacter italicus TaxID=481446 RepID=UPI001C965FC7|nr:aldehyde dehydrogenase family protein [Phaeobacter italicus]MBY5976160.1 aldehyde dehydrogenase family protein [Phaeobacter italicus]MEC8575064.1 aldehyde dehydrogenase family protein [Pseudomonadota bacterium]
MEFRNFIGGEWRETAAASANINPSDISDVIGYAAESDAAEIDHAVGAAKAAAVSWSASTPQQRFDVLDFIGSELLARKDELGHLLAREEGKTLAEGIAETARAGQIFKFFAGEALRGGGEAMASVRPGVGVEITRSPVGVVGLITPWNFPMAIPAWKTAPALAYGNAVVLKPAELTPGCAHALAEIIARSGLPDGVFNLVLGKGKVTGARLVEHRDTDAISFTGSAETGSEIAATCGRLRKKLQMEMGGKNPMVVLDDADLDLAVEACLNGAFYSTGQRCTASSRLIVAGGIHDRFVASLTGRIAALRVGNALDRATEIGPVVDGRQLDKDLSYLDIAAKEGGQVFGGQTLQRTTNGFFLAPALITETNSGMRINQEEVFGPIASVSRVEDYEAALQVANDTPFGLSAGICTGSLKHATHFKANAEAGMVMVNLPTAGVDYHVPFGGTKGSSFGGREQGAHAKEFYSKIKTSYTFA